MATYNRGLTFVSTHRDDPSVPVDTIIYTVPSNKWTEVFLNTLTGAGTIGIFNNVNLQIGTLTAPPAGQYGTYAQNANQGTKLGPGYYLKVVTGGVAYSMFTIEWSPTN